MSSYRLDARRRAERAASLNAVGQTWQAIADACGYRSRQAAQQAVKRLDCRVMPENIEALRRQEDEELRIRREMFHEELCSAKANQDTDTMVMLNRELNRISERRARLLGLDVPVRTEIDVNVRQSATAILARAEADLLAIAGRQNPQPVLDAEVIE